jgi:hypothetical protein
MRDIKTKKKHKRKELTGYVRGYSLLRKLNKKILIN